MPEEIFLTVLEVSAAVGGITLLIKLFSPILNKYYPAKWKYWVWLILALRLLFPVNIDFPEPPVRVSIPQVVVAGNAEQEQSFEEIPGVISDSDIVEPGEMATTPAPVSREVMLWEIVTVIWLAGGAVFLTAAAVRGRLFRRRIFRWAKPVQEEIRVLLAEEAAFAGVKPPRIVCSEMAASPMAVGLFRPVLVLPHTDYEKQDLRFILRHELCHLQRLDLWYKLILLLANAVNWFNPLIYLLVREANVDLERSCDSKVVRGLDYEGKKAYSETILAAIRREKHPPSALSTCFWGGKKIMKERFRNILDSRKYRRGFVLFFVVILLAVAAGGLVSCDLKEKTPVLPGNESTDGVITTDKDEKPAKVHTVIFTGFRTAGTRSETTVISTDGQIPPQGYCIAVENDRASKMEMEPLGLEIILPAEWELKTPAAGEPIYNDFGTYSPVNIYKDGVCIGTMGCDSFFENQLEEWEKAWVPGGSWSPAEEYWGLYWTRMTGNCRWEELTEVRQTEEFFAGVCRVFYDEKVSGTGKAQANKGILAHDASLLQYVSIEIRDDMATEEELAAIAESIRLFRATAPSEQPEEPVLTEPSAPEGEEFEKVEITFPAYEERNGYNDEVFDIAPFKVSIYLPEGCSIQPISEEGKQLPTCRYNVLWSKMGIFRDGKQIGTVGYNIFEDIPGSEDAYMAVYSEIMLGSLVSWDSEYTPTVEAKDHSFGSATCGLVWKEVPEGTSAAEVEYERCPAVLAYNRELQVYIGAAFEESSITPEQQKAIARSIVIQTN